MKSIKQVATYLGVHVNTVNKKIKRGEINTINIKGTTPPSMRFVTDDELELYETVKDMEVEGFYTRVEFAHACGVSPKTVDSWVLKGWLVKSKKIGRSSYYDIADIWRFK